MAKLIWREIKTRKKPVKKTASVKIKKAAPVKKKASEKKARRHASKPKKTVASRKPVKKVKRTAIRKTAKKSPRIAPKKAPAQKTKPSVIPVVMTDIEKIVAQVSAGQEEESLIEGSKFNIGVDHNAHALASKDIPLEYGKNSVHLLVVDPKFAFTYWEVCQDDIWEATKQLGNHAKLTLRFYDITRTNNPDTSSFWDVEVFDRLGNWYLKLEHPDQRICLDVGMKNQAGEFYRFARSNVMKLPSQSLARPGPIKWMIVTPSGEKLISDIEEYTDADMELLKKILGPYFFDLLMRGRFASLAGSSIEAIFFDVSSLKMGESPSGNPPWGTP